MGICGRHALAAVPAVLFALATAAVASAAAVDQYPVSSAQTNGRVNAIAVMNGVAYIGGDFTSVRAAGQSSGGVTRNHLAAIDLSTGAVTSWDPGANGSVQAVAASGGTVYVGGTFTTAGGASRTNLAAISASSGSATSWNPGANAEVRTLLAANGRLYAGGKFTTAGGASRTRLAAFSLSTGALDTGWHPSAGRTVSALEVAADGTNDVLAGGGSSGVAYFARLAAATGAAQPWTDLPPYPVEDISATPAGVYMGMGGPGGKLIGYSTTGSQRWVAQVDGDVQAVVAFGSTVYGGGHFVEYCDGGTGSGAPFLCDVPISRGKLFAVDAATGALDPWDPQANGALGVFALEQTPAGLAAGGEFTKFAVDKPTALQIAQQGFAMFGSGGGGPDTSPPTAPGSVAAAAQSPTSVKVTWSASMDDVGVDHYIVSRDGTAVSGNVSGLSFSDTGLAPSTDHSYTVVAYDAAGNPSSPGGPASAHTPPNAPAGLSATAAGDTEIDLTWNTVSTAVSYNVYRDGAATAVATGLTSAAYNDAGLAAGSTHSYTVTAVDSAAAESAKSGPVSATTTGGGGGSVFADDFESGTLAKWTSVKGLVVQQATVLDGAWAARSTVTGTAKYAYVDLPATTTDLYYDVHFDLLSQGSNPVDLLRFRTAGGGVLLTLSVAPTSHKLRWRVPPASLTVTSPTVVSLGGWHDVVVHLVVNGTSGSAGVTYDGAPVAALTRTVTTGTTPIGRLQLGDSTGSRTDDVAFDDVTAHH
jgi:hypothetical protein